MTELLNALKTRDLSKLSLDELRQLQTKIEFLLELKAKFNLVPITDTHNGD